MKRLHRILAWMLSAAMMLSGVAYAAPADTADAAQNGVQEPVETRLTAGGMEPFSTEKNAALAAKKAAAAKQDITARDSAIAPAQKRVSAAEKRNVTALPDAPYAEGRLLVKAERGISLMSGDDLFAGLADEVECLFSVAESEPSGGVMLAGEEGPTADWFRVELAEGVDMLKAWNQLLTEDSVLCVEPDYLVQKQALNDITASDPYRHAQTWLDQIHANEAWEKASHPGKGVVVAVVDSGVDLDHPDLQDQLLPGYDFVEDDAQPDDVDGHGTHVAGIVGAAKNTVGVCGVAYGAQILPVRVLNDVGSGYTSEIANGIIWAAGGEIEGIESAAQQADVINLSLGGFGYSQLEQDAVDFARSQGCLVVAAAGNESLPTEYAGDRYYGAYWTPADIPGVLTVMAMNQAPNSQGDWLASFSNYDSNPGSGAEYEIMAPGVGIYSTGIGGEYVYMQGTSMACPVVVGAAAVLMGMGCSAEEAWELLVHTGSGLQGKTQPDGAVRYYPALNLQAAVEAKLSGTFTQAPVAANVEPVAYLPELDLGGGAVDFSGLNTSSRLYYYRGSLQSGLVVAFENFGGSGTVTFTGTIGGCALTPISVETAAGGVEAAPLTFSGTPAVEEGEVSIQLYANGAMVYDGYMRVLELKTPDMSGMFAVNGDYYVPTAETVTLEGSTECSVVWVLDRHMYIPENYTVNIGVYGNEQYGVVVYQDAGTYICNMYNSDTGACASLEFLMADLIAAETFAVLEEGDTYLYGCMVYDPWIEWVAESNQSIFRSSGYEALVSGWEIYASSFYDFYGLTIDCFVFERNLVNHCVYSTLRTDGYATANTFVENYIGYDGLSVMTVYAQDADVDAWNGFMFNSVVGPMSICWLDEEGAQTDYLAKVAYVYHQRADDLWMELSNQLQCDSDSLVSSDLADFATWNFAADSPVFVTGTEVDYDMSPSYDAVDFTITFHLSTAIDEYCWPYLESETDVLVSGAELEISDDRRSVTARTTAPLDDLEMIVDYQLGGICTADYSDGDINHYFWATELMGQNATAGSFFQSMRLQEFRTSGTQNGVQLSWADDRIRDGYVAEIWRGVDGGEPVKLAEVDALAGTYEDTTIEGGHIYWYEVSIVYNGVVYYHDSTEFVYSLWTPHGGEDFAVVVNDGGTSVTVQLNSPWLVRNLTYTLPESMADKIEFAEQVQQSGLSYGAVSNGDGTVTVTIGRDGEAEAFAAGDLFTVTAESGAACSKILDDICCTGSSGLQLWHLGEYTVFVAGYQNGQMTNAELATEWKEICSAAGGSSWKVFITGDGYMPQQIAVNIP